MLKRQSTMDVDGGSTRYCPTARFTYRLAATPTRSIALGTQFTLIALTSRRSTFSFRYVWTRRCIAGSQVLPRADSLSKCAIFVRHICAIYVRRRQVGEVPPFAEC